MKVDESLSDVQCGKQILSIHRHQQIFISQILDFLQIFCDCSRAQATFEERDVKNERKSFQSCLSCLACTLVDLLSFCIHSIKIRELRCADVVSW